MWLWRHKYTHAAMHWFICSDTHLCRHIDTFVQTFKHTCANTQSHMCRPTDNHVKTHRHPCVEIQTHLCGYTDTCVQKHRFADTEQHINRNMFRQQKHICRLTHTHMCRHTNTNVHVHICKHTNKHVQTYRHIDTLERQTDTFVRIHRHICAKSQMCTHRNTFRHTKTKYVKQIFKYKVKHDQTNRQSHTCKNGHIYHMCRYSDGWEKKITYSHV